MPAGWGQGWLCVAKSRQVPAVAGLRARGLNPLTAAACRDHLPPLLILAGSNPACRSPHLDAQPSPPAAQGQFAHCGPPRGIYTSWGSCEVLHIAGIPGQFAHGWEPAGPIAWPGPLFRSWVKAEAPALGPAHPIGPKVMGAKSHRGAAGGSPPSFGDSSTSAQLTAAAGVSLKGQDEVAG